MLVVPVYHSMMSHLQVTDKVQVNYISKVEVK